MPRTVAALTVRQPYAAAIVIGRKDVENRSWSTPYRGKLYIHAGVYDSGTRVMQLAQLLDELLDKQLPTHAFIGSVELVDIVNDSRSAWAVRGMLHWVLRDPIAFAQPIICRGQPGLWRPPVGVVGEGARSVG